MGPAVRRWKVWAAAAGLAASALVATGAAPPSAAQQPDEAPTTTTTATTAPPAPPPPPSTPTTAPTSPPPPTTAPTTPPPTEVGPAPTTPVAPADDPPPAAPPTGPAPLAATAITLDPASELVDGTTVAVAATGLPAGAWVRAVQCRAGAEDPYADCDAADASYAQADDAGAAAFTLKVDALMGIGWDGPEQIDCRAEGACTLVVADDGGTVLAQAPLPFVADGPLAPPPVLTVSPPGPFTHNQTVTVTATGLVWADEARLLQCAVDAAHVDVTALGCDSESEGYLWTGEGGSVTTPFAVSAVIDTATGPVDCRAPGSCALVVTQDGLRSPGKRALAPIEFDPSTEVVPPTLTLTPPVDLVDGQTVTATGSGFGPGWVSLYLCDATPSYEDCLGTDAYADIGPTGAFTVEVDVEAIIPTSTGEVDCRTADEPCLLVAARNSLTSVRAGRAELHFDPDGPVRPGPAITVTPDHDLPDEATITVAGTNFGSDGESALLTVCQAGDSGLCDAQAESMVAPDNDGTFTAEVGIAATFATWSSGTVDCRVAPGCEVVAQIGYQGRRARAGLSFAPPDPGGDRYLDPVFDQVDVTRDLAYRHTTDAAGAPVDLALDVYEPAGDSETARPVVVWLHGGWYSAGDRTEMAGYAQAFAERGYVAVSMEYRMRPGLRCCPTDDVEGVTAAIVDATDDAAAGVRWLRDHAADYGIDPDAIAVGGHEGGAAAAYGLAHLPGQMGRPGGSSIAAALPIAGVDLGRADGGEPPFLAFHDTADRTAPQHLSASACTRARAAGTPCGAVGYGLAWNGGLATSRQRDIVRRSSDFLAEVVLDPLGYLEWTGPTTPTGPTGPGDPGSGPGSGGGSGGGPGSGSGPTPVATATGGPAVATLAAVAHARGTLPRTGAELAQVAALALGLGALGAACLLARRRRLQLGADRGDARLVGVAALAAVALVVGGFVVTSNLSPTSSSDGADDRAGAADPSADDEADGDDVDHDAMGHGDHDGADDTDHDAMAHAAGAHDADHDTAAHRPGDHDGAGHPRDHAGGGPDGDGHGHPVGADDPGHHPTNPADPGHHPTNPADPGHHPTDPTDPGHHPTDPPGPGDPPDDGFDPTWTPEQTAYARALVDGTETQLARYANPAVLPLLGYQWILDGTTPDGYQHWIHLSRIVDQRTLDPAFPESLVFRNAGDGPVLEAAMYMLNVGYTMANIPADIAWLPGWHVHENLCFVGNFELVGVTVNGRCERGSVIVTPPMVHVWRVDTPCGRFPGVDEHGLQCHHEH